MILRAVLLALVSVTFNAAPTIAARNTQPGRVVVVGDSIVGGSGTVQPIRRNSYPARLQTRLGQRVPIVKHPAGCLVAQGCLYGPTMLETYASEVLPLAPSHVILSMGVNDLCHVPDKQLRDAFRWVLHTNRAHGIRTTFATITPQNANWQWRCEAQRVRINDWLLDRFPGRTADVASVLETPRGNLRSRYDSGDGLHPNNRGADRIGAYLAKYLARRGQ